MTHAKAHISFYYCPNYPHQLLFRSIQRIKFRLHTRHASGCFRHLSNVQSVFLHPSVCPNSFEDLSAYLILLCLFIFNYLFLGRYLCVLWHGFISVQLTFCSFSVYLSHLSTSSSLSISKFLIICDL